MDARSLQLPGTDALHPDGQYGAAAKAFHWLTVALMAVTLPMGFVIQHIKDSDKMAFYTIHESAGLTILLVAAARLAWRLSHPPPPLPDSIPAPMRLAAGVNHWLLYAALIAQPVLGFVATTAQGFPLQGKTAYLGLIDLPKFMEANKALAHVVQSAHTGLGRLALKKNQGDLAVREFKAALALGPADRAGAHCDLGEAYLAKGLAADAKREALAALEIAPSFERAQDLLLKSIQSKSAGEPRR